MDKVSLLSLGDTEFHVKMSENTQKVIVKLEELYITRTHIVDYLYSMSIIVVARP